MLTDEAEVLPLVEKIAKVKLTKDPDARATMGGSSGGSAALIMAWYHPELYHRVLTYSGTYVYQQWPYNPETPHGAWDFHEKLIPNSPRKPIRLWMHVSDRDNLITRDAYHDWVLANERMAKVLEAAHSSMKNVAFSSLYALTNSIIAKIRATRFDYYDKAKAPASTLLLFEGLPSMDASFAIELVAVPQ